MESPLRAIAQTIALELGEPWAGHMNRVTEAVDERDTTELDRQYMIKVLEEMEQCVQSEKGVIAQIREVYRTGKVPGVEWMRPIKAAFFQADERASFVDNCPAPDARDRVWSSLFALYATLLAAYAAQYSVDAKEHADRGEAGSAACHAELAADHVGFAVTYAVMAIALMKRAHDSSLSSAEALREACTLLAAWMMELVLGEPGARN